MPYVQFKIINIPFIINNKKNKTICYYFISLMINKKLKSYLQYQIVHPQSYDNNSTLIKLKALSKSAEKVRQKSKSGNTKKSEIMNQTFTTVTHTNSNAKTKSESKSREKKRMAVSGGQKKQDFKQIKKEANKQEKEKFQSLNSQILELQNKMKILFTDKGEKQLSVSGQKKLSTPKRMAKMKKNPEYFAESCRLHQPLLKNEKLVHIKPSQGRSSTLQNIVVDDLIANISILKGAKLLSIKMLKNLRFFIQQPNYFDECQNIEELFQYLQSAISLNIYNHSLLLQKQIKIEQEQAKKWEKLQTEHLRAHINDLKNEILQHKRQQITNDQQINLFNSKTQQQQSEIHRLKILLQETQYKFESEKRDKEQLQRKLCRSKKENEKILLEFMGKVEEHKDLHSKLKNMINQQIEENKNLKLNRKLLTYQIEKCQKQYYKICEKLKIYKEEKQDMILDKCLDLELYQDYHRAFKQTYIQTIQELLLEIEGLREVISTKQQETMNSKQQSKFWKKQAKLYQQDYLRLNDDYSKAVADWVTKQQQFQKQSNWQKV